MTDVKAPDGKTIRFPDSMSKEQILDVMRRKFGNKPKTGVGEDIARSGAAGLGKGASQLLGGFGDAASMTGDAAAWAAGKMGAPQWAQNAARTAGKYSLGPLGVVPGSQQIEGAIADATRPNQNLSGIVTGQKPKSFIEYEPQTMQGDYAKTIGEFAPAMALGPGRAATKVASGLGAGLLSETAGQLTEGQAAEPYARLGGALLGGGVAGVKNAKDAMLNAGPSGQSVKAVKNSIYKALETGGVRYDAIGYEQWARGLAQRLQDEGIDTVLEPKASQALARIMAHVGGSPKFVEMEALRKITGRLVRNPDPSERYFGGLLTREVDNFFDNSALISNGSIPAGQVSTLAKRARELARRDIISRDIKEMTRKGETYVSGDESGIRNQFANYLRSPRGKGLTKEEREAFKKVSRREGLYNLLTTTGGRLNLAVSPAAGGLLGSAMLTPILGPFAPLAGAAIGVGSHLGARKIMEGVTKRAASRADKTVLLGRAKQKNLPKRDRAPAISYVRGGLLANQSQAD